MNKIVAYRACPDSPWVILECRLSKRMSWDDYEACHRARDLVRQGAIEARVMQSGQVWAKFTRTATGEVIQDGGVTL